MRRFIRYVLILAITFASITISPVNIVSAQASFPAELNKNFAPISIASGGLSTLTVSIFNPNSFPLSSAAWTDTLPAGVTIASPLTTTNTCGGTVTAAAGGPVFSLSGGNVPAQVGATPGQCSVTIQVTSTTAGNHVNTLDAGALSSIGNGNPISNTTPASATLTVGAVASPALSKNFAPNTIFVGQTSTLQIQIRNTDTATALTNVFVTDNLPANVTVAGAPSLNAACGGGTASSTATSVTLTGGTIAPGATCTISIPVTSNTADVYSNVIPANAVTTQQGVTNAGPATAPLNVQDVSIAKAFSPSTVLMGQTTTLTITLRNPTGTPYTGAAITDPLPAGILVANPPAPSTTCGAGATVTALDGASSFNMIGGTIPSGTPSVPGTCTITVTVRVNVNGTRTNTLGPGALTTDQGATNVLPATANVTGQATGTGARGNKNFNPPTIAAGGTTRLRINITAPPDTALTNLGVTDNLPSNVFIANPPNTNTNCGAGAVMTAVPGGTSFSLSNGTLAAGASCVVDVFVTSTTPGIHTNTVLAGGITNAENRPNTSPFSSDLTVLSGLTVGKAFSPSTISPGTVTTLTITLTNANMFPLTGVTATDPLPTAGGRQILVAPTPNASTTCVGGTVNAVSGSATVSMTGGTVPAQVGGVPGICTISVNVVGSLVGAGTPGNIINTIPVNGVTSIEGINNLQPANATLTLSNLTMRMVKGFVPNLVTGGASSTMTVELINPNNITLTGAAFTDTMPANMIVAAPLTTGTTCAGGAVTATVGSGSFSYSGGSIPANSSCLVTISITMTISGNLTNVIPAGAVTTLNGVTNPDPAAASLTNLPGVTVNKAFTPNQIPVGGISQLRIIVVNVNPFALTALALTDTLPTGLTVASPSAVANTCGGTLTAVSGTDTIQLSGGSVAPNQTCTLDVNVTGTQLNSFTNTIPPGALTNAEGATNTASAVDTLTISAALATPTLTPTVTPIGGVGSGGAGAGAGGVANLQPPATITPIPSPTPDPILADPQISKTGDPSLAIPGEIVNWDIAVTNRGTGPAANFVVNETLPGVLQFISASADQGTFSVNGQSITFNVGTVNPGQVIHLRIQSRVDPNVQPPMNVANIAVADWLGRRLRATANLRITRGRLPNTGEKGPTAPPPNDIWLPLIGLSILIVPIGYTIYRRRRSAA